MIRFAFDYEAENLKQLWAKVFRDSDEAIDMFFDFHFKPENTAVCIEDNKIVAMFFLLPGKLNNNNCIYNSYYLYAACTDKEYRGRGIMKNLIEFAIYESKKRQINYIFLLPAEDSLYGYYENFGFVPIYGKTTNVYTFDELDNNTQISVEHSYSSDYLYLLRKNLCSHYTYFEWDSTSIDFAVKFNKYYGAKFISNCNGYLLYTIADDKIFVKENTFTNIRESEIAQYICFKHQCNKAVFNSPSENNKIREKFGMVLPLNSLAESIIKENNNVYLNLTLD